MRISTKMVIGYVLLIVLPFILFAVFIYYQLNDKLLTQYRLVNQQNIEQLAATLDSSLNKIESLRSIYQNNTALIDYLRGDYMEERDLIYSYLRDISPAISFASLAEPSIESLVIYPRSQTRLLTVSGFSAYNNIYDSLSKDEIASLGPTKGLWKYSMEESGLSLSYYYKIYNDLYTNDLGIIAFHVKPVLVQQFLQNLQQVHPGNAIILMDQNKRILHDERDAELTNLQLTELTSINQKDGLDLFAMNDHARMINSVTIPRLGLEVFEINKPDMLLQAVQSKKWWVAGGIGALILLTVLYYLIVSSLTKRILLLSRHMRRVGSDSLNNHFTGKLGTDEIGFLIRNYNAMITRMDELVNHVQKVELLKKEADFKMLQAQIQPHFLYNTLETMRMLARSNRDYTVADMAYSLANLLRYSLSKSDDTLVKDELDHVRAYIGIHQIRIPDLVCEMNIDDSLLTIRCPRFILQPLVENCMLHGLSKKRGAKWISIGIRRLDDRVIVEIADNGAGIESGRLFQVQHAINEREPDNISVNTGMGIGLHNVAQRIKAYFGQDSAISIASRNGDGAICSLSFVPREEDRYVQTDDRG
ncbi:two-component system sensor histidine kinase YesM [Paenibacillus phyllosphaerae]|uniref:Two-component system sensor histidine kinase YesM n=1 Tax=Paenibacillus phyllosphaerae TaxID=274593 RepID=A0A7W5FPK0_9BACL|nr:sensor histidine kinase [Paenibacillus phyllosphaerae]MBB3112124.1 two-component system sensor histidine kinase YesM [Paenibacillus phyllosphaerae]